MKKYLSTILIFLVIGCGSIPIKSDNGSFRNSLKSKYYEKGNYLKYDRAPHADQILTNVDIDEVIQQGRIVAYLLNVHVIIYVRLNKDGLRPTMDEDKLRVLFYRIYIDDKTKGFKIVILEDSGREHFCFDTYQEIFVNEKGEYVICENIPEKEARRKRIKWDDTRY